MERRLTVLYDASCALCRRARGWLDRQAQNVRLEFVAAASNQARQRFPELDPAETLKEMYVVDEHGQVYRGEKAWLMCLWALEDYRDWSLRLAKPGRIDHAKRFVGWVSSRRHFLGGRRHAS